MVRCHSHQKQVFVSANNFLIHFGSHFYYTDDRIFLAVGYFSTVLSDSSNFSFTVEGIIVAFYYVK